MVPVFQSYAVCFFLLPTLFLSPFLYSSVSRSLKAQRLSPSCMGVDSSHERRTHLNKSTIQTKQWMGEIKKMWQKQCTGKPALHGHSTPSLRRQSTAYFSCRFVLSQNHNTKRKCKRLCLQTPYRYRKNEFKCRRANKKEAKKCVWCFGEERKVKKREERIRLLAEYFRI